MYKVSVPIMLTSIGRSDRNGILRQLEGLDAERVFLALAPYTTDEKEIGERLELLKKETAFFKAHGYEVGCWTWTFMFSGDHPFTGMTFSDGRTDREEVCPSDPAFVDFACDYISRLAQTGVDLIMFDDDFRYGFLDGDAACLCKNHRAYMEKLLGEPLPADLKPYLFAGGANPVRSAWIKSKGHYFREFAKRIREAVDKVAPRVRVGICSCMSVWDQDGVSTDELARILAGGTKPFMRLIGAPYWASRRSSLGKYLQYVIELERLERSWVERPEEIEIFSEGDAYPRPRYACPASYVEGFDTALRADGRLDGILKYGMDYTSTTAYEDGYVQRHIKNRPAYRAIDAFFGGKTAAGVRIYRARDIYENADIPKAVEGSPRAQYLFFPDSSNILSTLSVPTAYSGEGTVGAAFGEAAKYLEPGAFENGLILDAAAAKILTDRGVDVGLREYGESFSPALEYYPDAGEYVTDNGGVAVKIKADEKARITSVFSSDSSVKYDYGGGFDPSGFAPASYLYENAAGQRFLVLCWEAAFNSEYMWRKYTLSRLIADSAEWLSGKKLPAYVYGAPDLYVMAKEGGGKLAVGLWNFSADEVAVPTVELAKEYKSAKFFNCTGSLQGDKLVLSRLEPFGFCFAELCD